jgi:hypothetical protein
MVASDHPSEKPQPLSHDESPGVLMVDRPRRPTLSRVPQVRLPFRIRLTHIMQQPDQTSSTPRTEPSPKLSRPALGPTQMIDKEVPPPLHVWRVGNEILIEAAGRLV